MENASSLISVRKITEISHTFRIQDAAVNTERSLAANDFVKDDGERKHVAFRTPFGIGLA